MPTWTQTASNEVTWATASNLIILSVHSTYDEEGLDYDLSGNTYDSAIPDTGDNANLIWNSTTITTTWA